MTRPPLYHYTCRHGRDAIGIHGIIRATRDSYRAIGRDVPPTLPMLTMAGYIDVAPLLAISWFTDLDTPDIDGLGLTRQLIDCDRTEYRYELDPREIHDIEPWVGSTFRHDHWAITAGLEHPGTLPRHWWIAHKPVAAVLTSGGD